MIDRIAFILLWATTFSLPWEDIVALPGLDASEGVRISRLIGLVACAAAFVALLATGRLRVPKQFHLVGALFVLWSGLSVLWSIDPEATVERTTTYAQLLLLSAVLWQLAWTERRQLLLLQAYVLGAYVSVVDTVLSYLRGDGAAALRYAAGDFNVNDLGFTLVLALPMAWYLSLVQKNEATRWLNRLYLPLGMGAVLLTASRGAFLAAVASLLFVPWSLTRLRWRTRALVVALLAGSAAFLVTFVPVSSWQRIGQTESEITEGTLTHRRQIWQAGFLVVAEHPFVGTGAGTFSEAAAPYLDRPRASHNTFLSVLVEQGAVGMAIFGTLFVTTVASITRMPTLPRRFWIVVACTLIIGLMPRNWDYRKATWFVLVSMASHGAMVAVPRLRTRRASRRAGVVVQAAGGSYLVVAPPVSTRPRGAAASLPRYGGHEP